ncbi:hypothetical protein PgNI_11415 [Pyricularia grisea]|uniref:Uncharacterized protein n=1 Tax=Pyricularia grisea TaxID=148305 RepID=A0A6P8AQ60_PYRGI|nr:hypothetical protein PgNI_11415 [Pyricularia grisea]TLD04171.1 hypothetical protein PgNI_11415 [Pyricularia grisea]
MLQRPRDAAKSATSLVSRDVSCPSHGRIIAESSRSGKPTISILRPRISHFTYATKSFPFAEWGLCEKEEIRLL